MKKILILLATLFMFSCTHKTHDTELNSEFCLTLDYEDKIICLDAPVDTTAEYIFIQDNFINQQYSDLVVNYMMVVDIKETQFCTVVILSNPEYSIEVTWTHSELPQIEDMFYIISNSKFLHSSVLIESGISPEETLDDIDMLEP